MGKYVFGIDLGGTTVKIGYFLHEGTLVEKWEIPTNRENGGQSILQDIAGSITQKLAENGIPLTDVIGAGLGVPGPARENGWIPSLTNIGWKDINPNNILSELLGGIPVRTANDANVAALGEMWKGGGEGYQNLVAVTLGTGVGGGIVVNGKILTGVTGAGGEIGHIHVNDQEDIACGCGCYGCLEQYASATGVVRLAKQMLDQERIDSVLLGQEVTAKNVWDAVKDGDALAIEVAKIYGSYLGKGLSIVANVVNPEIFVLGGGVAKAGNVLIDYLKPAFDKNVFFGAREAKFALAKLGNDAGIYGAAKFMLQ